MEAYIQDISAFVPNDPVNNDTMEEVLGMVGEVPSKTRRVILRSNGIKQRYYAIDPATGNFTHSNAEMTAEAVRLLRPYPRFSINHIECLACGTSTPDQLMPGHGSMVHGLLGNPPCEAVSTIGICLSGISAMKYALMNVASGMSQNAVATGSELPTSFLRARFYNVAGKNSKKPDLGEILPFEADFLRWMLSDGAGALFVAPSPRKNGPSLKLDWMETLSFANMLPACMYAGAEKNGDGSITGWRQMESPLNAIKTDSLAIRQDLKLLNDHIMQTLVDRALPMALEKHPTRPEEIDWLLPHISSNYFRQKLYDHMKTLGFKIPYERWFINLEEKGNTGAASIYIMLEELFHSGRLKKGQRLFLIIPESGRFSICYAMLTVV